MAKYLKDVLKGKNASTKKVNDLGGYKPKAGDEEKFAKQHEIEKYEDRVGNDDSAYMAKNIKPVLLKPEEKRHKDAGGVYESKKAEDISCNRSPAGTKCPIHEMADCTSAKIIKELSPQKMGDYVKSASADVGHKKADAAYARMSGDDKQADKLTNKARQRLGGIYTAVNKITREEVEEIEELSTDTYHRAAKKAANKAMWDPEGRSGKTFKKYAGMANKFRDKGMSQEKKEKAMKEEAIDEAYDKNSKAHQAAKKTVKGMAGLARAEFHDDGSATVHTKGNEHVSSVRVVDHHHDVNGLGYNRPESAYKKSSFKKDGLTHTTKSVDGGHTIHIHEETLEEKHLTSTEMKKREEVAMAIHRENPKMPMGKKMAIATSTAKKVAEETVEEGYDKKLRDIVKEANAVEPLLQSEDASISIHNNVAHVKDHKGNVVAKYSHETHGANWKNKAKAHAIRLRESDTPITLPGMNQDNNAGTV